jgi:hypothetical protein
MALKISIQNSNVGVPFTEAYANADARQANAQEVASHAFYCATPQGNLMDGLYADLKLQAGFENAEDC